MVTQLYPVLSAVACCYAVKVMSKNEHNSAFLQINMLNTFCGSISKTAFTPTERI